MVLVKLCGPGACIVIRYRENRVCTPRGRAARSSPALPVVGATYCP